MIWIKIVLVTLISVSLTAATCSVAQGMFNTTTIEVIGRYTWKLLYHINNSNNSGWFKRKVKYDVSSHYSYSKLKKSLTSTTKGFSLGLSASVPIKIVRIGAEAGFNFEIGKAFEHVTNFTEERKIEAISSYEIVVGPNQTQGLYQLIFHMPGLTQYTETLSTEEIPMDDEKILVDVETPYYLRNIEIFYSSDLISQPRNSICELKGKSHDVNHGFKGDRVWLVPRWTTDINQAATGIEVVIQDEWNSYYEDLAPGAGGKYRYLKMFRNAFSNGKVGSVALYRTKSHWKKPKGQGWEFSTGDINKGRGGEYLYLCWNTIST